jgi:Uncharacterised protein family (UPF0014)
MMIGNSMTATVLAGRRLTDELRDKRDEVEPGWRWASSFVQHDRVQFVRRPTTADLGFRAGQLRLAAGIPAGLSPLA